MKEDQRIDVSGIDVRAYHRTAWNREVEGGNRWTVPVDDETIARVARPFGGRARLARGMDDAQLRIVTQRVRSQPGAGPAGADRVQVAAKACPG